MLCAIHAHLWHVVPIIHHRLSNINGCTWFPAHPIHTTCMENDDMERMPGVLCTSKCPTGWDPVSGLKLESSTPQATLLWNCWKHASQQSNAEVKDEIEIHFVWDSNQSDSAFGSYLVGRFLVHIQILKAKCICFISQGIGTFPFNPTSSHYTQTLSFARGFLYNVAVCMMLSETQL